MAKHRTKTMSPTQLVNKVTPEETKTISITRITPTSPIIEVKEEIEEPVVETVEEVKVSKPVVLANAKTEIVTPVVKDPSKQVSQSVLFIRQYINNYLAYVSQKEFQSIDKSISLFRNIINYVLNHQEMSVIEEVYQFFRKNRKSLLSPTKALQGIETLPVAQQEKLQQVYALFYHISGVAGNKARKLDLDYAAKYVGDGNLIAFIAKKMM